MADLKKLSDAELDAMIAGQTRKQPPTKDLSSLSDDELDSLINQQIGPSQSEPKGLVQTALDKYDSYAGAPLRAGFNELVRTTPEFGKAKPSFFGNLMEAGKAFANQFGEEPSLAPTGKDISAKRFGLSTQSVQPANTSFLAAKGGIAPEAVAPEAITVPTNASPAGYVGAGLDATLDLGNLVPVGTIAGGVGKAGKATGELALKGSAKALDFVPGGRGIKNVAKGTANLIDNFVRPNVSKDFKELSEIAARNNIDVSKAPEALEFGKDSAISGLGRAQAQSPLGQARSDAAKEFYGQVTDALDNKVAEISKGPPLPAAEAGVHVRDSFADALSNLFKENEVRYSTIAQQNPNTPMDPALFANFTDGLKTMEADAKKAIARNFTPASTQQAQMLLNKAAAISQEAATLDGAIDVLSSIGEVAFPKGSQGLFVGPDLKKTRDLYFKLRDTIVDSIDKTLPNGPEIANKLKESNKNISQFMKTIEPIENILGNQRLAPEQVFNQITRTSSQIDALKKVLPADDFARLKGSYLDQLLARSEDGFVSFPAVRKSFENRQRRAVFEQLFDEAEAKDILDIARVGEAAGDFRFRPDTSMGLNFQDIKTGVTNAFIGEPTLEGLKSRARARALRLPTEVNVAPQAAAPRFGPQAIGPTELIGLRLPQQKNIKQKEKERGR